MPTALLFDRDRLDEIDDWPNRIGPLGRRSILWIDLDSPDREQIAELVEMLELDPETGEQLEDADGKPFLGDFGSYLHVTAFAPSRKSGVTELSGAFASPRRSARSRR